MIRRLRSVLRSRAIGAMVAQVWQAAGSFLLQIAAAWTLGAEGLGRISLCLGMIVLATAVVSGMVGDSLTVLDRDDQRIRAGLQGWVLILLAASLIVAVSALTMSHLLTPTQALLFGGALVLFQLEELVRRVFMAEIRFWWLVVIDSVALAFTGGVIAVWAAVGSISLTTFLLALLVGQAAGLVAGIALLPVGERRLVSLRGADLMTVARFGVWRGAQVSANPTVLAGVRVIVTVAVGAAALGQVEAARIFAAPVMLAVQGLGSYLMVSYVRDRSLRLAEVYRRARRSSMTIIAGAVAGGAVLTLLAPLLSPIVTGPQVPVLELAVIGWVCYAIGSASYAPFASLATVRGRPAHVLACRAVDVATTLIVLAALLIPTSLPATIAPFIMATGLVLGGFLVRLLILRPLLRASSSLPVPVTTKEATRVHI